MGTEPLPEGPRPLNPVEPRAASASVPAVEPAGAPKSRGGFRRLASALLNSWAGIRHAAQHETAIRQELVGLAVLAPVSVVLPVSRLEHLILVLSLLLVLLVEFLNSAIESTVDRISLEHHPLAGRAKDLGSAAVLIAVLMWGLSWLVIVGPVVAHLFAKQP